MTKEVCIFILTHGRADKQTTLNTLQRLNCKIPVYLVIDDEDKDKDKYLERYDNVLVFNKDKAIEELNIDLMDNLHQKDCVVMARNVCFKLAKELGYDYFLELDDDYSSIGFRYPEGEELKSRSLTGLDDVIYAYIDFLKQTKFDAIALAQGGDYIGGLNSVFVKKGFKRKLMNFMFFKTDNPVEFMGTINEDVNAYTYLASKGRLFITPNRIYLTQETTQENKGGLTDIYKRIGTYVKSFYTVMLMPSAVKIKSMGSSRKGEKRYWRIHHSINWNNCIPKIIKEKHKKQIE